MPITGSGKMIAFALPILQRLPLDHVDCMCSSSPTRRYLQVDPSPYTVTDSGVDRELAFTSNLLYWVLHLT
jgi:hypothetical protein